MRETCKICGEELLFMGYSGSAEYVSEIMLCPNCDRGRLPDHPDKDSGGSLSTAVEEYNRLS